MQKPMYAALSPIRAADSSADLDVQSVLARIDALAVVLAAIARLSGPKDPPPFDALARRAELAAALATQPVEAIGVAARELDTLGVELHAGWRALDKARVAARMNRAAAALLHDECLARYRMIVSSLERSVTR